MVLFTITVKKIKDAAYKNGDVDGTCKQAFISVMFRLNRSSLCQSLLFCFLMGFAIWNILPDDQDIRQDIKKRRSQRIDSWNASLPPGSEDGNRFFYKLDENPNMYQRIYCMKKQVMLRMHCVICRQHVVFVVTVYAAIWLVNQFPRKFGPRGWLIGYTLSEAWLKIRWLNVTPSKASEVIKMFLAVKFYHWKLCFRIVKPLVPIWAFLCSYEKSTR